MRLISLVVVALLVLPPAIAQAEGPKTVLVLDLRPIGMPETAVATITAHIAEHLSKRPEIAVSTMTDLKDTLSLEQTKQIMGCKEDSVCMENVTDALRSDLVLTGSVGKIGESVVVSLTLVDREKNAPISRISETVDSLAKLPEVLPGLLADLFGWEGAETAPRFRLAEGQKISLAVFDLTPSGVSKETSDNLTQILSVELKKIEGARVISKEDLKAMLNLEAQKELLGCQDDTSCIAEIGGALGVDKMVVGNVGKLAESYVVSLRLINPSEAKVDSRVTESYQGTEDQLIRAVRHAGRRLLGVGEAAKGLLAVSASEEDAEVYVDEKKLGMLPMPPVGDLEAGRHVVRLSRDGFFDWQSEIYVDPDETTAVWAKLNEKPKKWYQKWWVWTIIGGVLAGGITGTILALKAGDERGAVEIPYIWEGAQ